MVWIEPRLLQLTGTLQHVTCTFYSWGIFFLLGNGILIERLIYCFGGFFFSFSISSFGNFGFIIFLPSLLCLFFIFYFFVRTNTLFFILESLRQRDTTSHNGAVGTAKEGLGLGLGMGMGLDLSFGRQGQGQAFGSMSDGMIWILGNEMTFLTAGW